MRTLQRFLLVALLTGLVMGCQSKNKPVGGENTPLGSAGKFKKAQEAPQGPPLSPR
jgi:hypothetical protein